MIEFWNSLSYTTKFSSIAFLSTLIVGFVSIGALGGLLYYPVSFLFKSYPTLNDWHGDWVWPAMIVVGMAWSLGFVFGGLAWFYGSQFISSTLLLRIIYLLILWLWAAILWLFVLRSNFDSVG